MGNAKRNSTTVKKKGSKQVFRLTLAAASKYYHETTKEFGKDLNAIYTGHFVDDKPHGRKGNFS